MGRSAHGRPQVPDLPSKRLWGAADGLRPGGNTVEGVPMTTSSPARRRRLSLLLAAAFAAAVGIVVAAPQAESVTGPTATAITIAKVYTPSIAVPNTPGAGAPYVVQDVPFSVDLSTDFPLSYTKDTTVVLTEIVGPDRTVSVSFAFPANATTATIPSVTLPTPADNVTIQVAVAARRSTVTPGTASFDVLFTSLAAPFDSPLTGFGGGGGVGVPCSPTAADPVCGDLQLGNSAGVLSGQLLSQGAGDSFLQVLVAVDPQVYNNANPIKVVAKCDKSKCKGKGVNTYFLTVQLTPGSAPVTSPPCAAKGVVDPGLSFCTDYVQSKRDNAGDLLLVLLSTEDLKIIYG